MNEFTNVCIYENFIRPEKKVIADKNGVKVFSIIPSGVLMIDAVNGNEKKAVNTVESRPSVVYTPKKNIAEIIADKFFMKITPCEQVVYGDLHPRGVKGYDIKKIEPSDENAAFVSEHYTLGYTKEEVYEILKNRFMLGAYKDDKICGFIGMHEERSVGMLEVLPDYRREGLGSELIRAAVEKFRENGFTPFAHIISTNEKSLALHRKLEGVTFTGTVYWLNRR